MSSSSPAHFAKSRASSTARAAGSLGARLLSPEANMADTEAQISIPEFSMSLQMDPYLKPYEKDFERR